MYIPRIAKSAAFALTVLTATQIAFAQTQPVNTPAEGNMPPGKHHHHHGPSCDQKVDWQAKRTEMQNKFAQDLSLTPDQKSKVDALHQQYYDAHKSVFDAQKARYDEMCKLKAAGASESEIHAKMQAMPKTDFEKMKADHEKLDEQIKAVLTPDQVKKFDAMKAERAAKWQGKKGEWNAHHSEPTPPDTTP